MNQKSNDQRFFDEGLGEALQIARKQAGLTQEELARKLGLAAGTIQRYEYGTRRMSAYRLFKICKILPGLLLFFVLGATGPRPEEEEKQV